MTMQETINALVDEFRALPDWEERYAHIIALGKQLAPYPEVFREDKYKVSGCQSRVWLHATKQADGTDAPVGGSDARIHFEADSDAAIVKGLITILMKIYNDRTPEEILSVPPNFIQQLGLDQHLSVNRANGLASMMKQIQLYAAVLRSS